MSLAYNKTAAGGNTTGASPSVALTPSTNDLIVVFCQAVGNANVAPTCSDNNGGAYTLLWTAQSNGSANTLSCFVRNTLVVSAVSTAVTVACGTSTAAEVVAFTITGASAAGAKAVAQYAVNQNQAAATTPAVALTSAPNPYSLILSAVGNASTPAGVSVTPGWTLNQSAGQVGCGLAAESVQNSSGQTVTWGSTSSTAYAVGAIELISTPLNTGVNTSKVVAYSALATPSGVNVSKALSYLVAATPNGVSLSKLNGYAVLGAINTNPPTWPTFTFNNAVLDSAYEQSFDLSPAASPTTYTLNSGALPPGLALSNLTGDVGKISGTPTTTGTYTFTLLATNNYGTSVSPSMSIRVMTPSTQAAAPVITGTVLGSGTVGIGYSNPLTISGGQMPYMVNVSAGSLPNGITLNTGGSQVTLSGTPNTTGTFNFSLTTTDTNNSATTQSFSIVVSREIIVPVGTGLPSAIVGQVYSEALTEQGGESPFTFSITSGSLPAGLTMSSSGVIAGTPTTPGMSTITVTVTDGYGNSGSVPFTLAVLLPGGSNYSWVT